MIKVKGLLEPVAVVSKVNFIKKRAYLIVKKR